jgi:hypothetical protein
MVFKMVHKYFFHSPLVELLEGISQMRIGCEEKKGRDF